jgi:hypothetical protein
MKLFLVMQEHPYPPNRGGRADSWRRLCALHETGHRIFLTAFDYRKRGDAPDALALTMLKEQCEEVRLYPVDRSALGLIRRLPAILSLPSFAAARVLGKQEYAILLHDARHFDPDAIMLDGLHGAWAARKLASDLGKPLLYRSHNREFYYLKGQRALARSVRQKVGLWLATCHLKRQERDIHQISWKVFDISTDDLSYWQGQGFDNSVWLPPLIDPDLPEGDAKAVDVDIAWLGNLNNPNNMQGIRWFIGEVLPLLRAAMPDISVIIGGSRPTVAMIKLCKATPGITLIADTAQPAEVLHRGRILINPVKMSSGVNIKSIDMLSIGAPIVSTSAGVTGLPAEVRALFVVADDAPTFASACLHLLSHPDRKRAVRRAKALEFFGPAAIRDSFAQLGMTPGLIKP